MAQEMPENLPIDAPGNCSRNAPGQYRAHHGTDDPRAGHSGDGHGQRVADPQEAERDERQQHLFAQHRHRDVGGALEGEEHAVGKGGDARRPQRGTHDQHAEPHFRRGVEAGDVETAGRHDRHHQADQGAVEEDRPGARPVGADLADGEAPQPERDERFEHRVLRHHDLVVAQAIDAEHARDADDEQLAPGGDTAH